MPVTFRSLSRALELLDVMAGDRVEWTVTDLARASGNSLATTHRTIAALEVSGYVDRAEPRGPVTLGLKLLQLGEIVARRLDIRGAAARELRSLADETGDTAVLAIATGRGVVCIERVEGAYPIRATALQVGSLVPYHAAALALAVLAFLDLSEQKRILRKPLRKFTESTVTDSGQLMERLQQIRDQRVAYSVSETVEGTGAVASPIFNHEQRVVGSVAVTGVAERYANHRQVELEAAVIKAATAISATLGARPANQAVRNGHEAPRAAGHRV